MTLRQVRHRAHRLMKLDAASRRRVDQIAQRSDGKDMHTWINLYAHRVYKEGQRVNRVRDAMRGTNERLREAGAFRSPWIEDDIPHPET